MIPQITQLPFEKCLRLNIPFAAYLYPFEDTVRFIASLSDYSNNRFCQYSDTKFVIGPFGTGVESIISINGNANEEQVMALSDDTISNLPTHHTSQYESTGFDSYSKQIGQIVDWHRIHGGKTVLSRIINVRSSNTPVSVAKEYFALFPQCFRHIYFTPETGLWIGATPELLIDYNHDSSVVTTMSLAGTRKKGVNADTAWDEKNTQEHDIVTEYICDIFSRHGLDPQIDYGHAVSFGNIEHLCHVIKGHGDIDMNTLLQELSPTPAVCGFPKEHALKAISVFEAHDRSCYGGYIGVIDNKRTRLFVNLRCAFVNGVSDNQFCYTLFGGGGITAKSECNSEWIETAYKMNSLYRIITHDAGCKALFYPLNN